MTTDSPVTQLNFHSFVCACSTLQFIPCVSFPIPNHPLVSLLRCIEYSVEQHPRLLPHLHQRQDVGREEVYVRDYWWPRHHRRETLCILLFVRANNTSCSIHVVVHTLCFLLSFSIYKYVVLPPLVYTFHPAPSSDGCRILFFMATERYYSHVLSLPHSCTFFCLVCVTLPSFSSFSLYVVPSFCRSLSTFVLARFCRCLLYTSPSPRDRQKSRMPSSA